MKKSNFFLNCLMFVSIKINKICLKKLSNYELCKNAV